MAYLPLYLGIKSFYFSPIIATLWLLTHTGLHFRRTGMSKARSGVELNLILLISKYELLLINKINNK